MPIIMSLCYSFTRHYLSMSLGLVQNQAQNKIIKGSIALATHLSKAGGRNLIESLIS